MKGKGKGEWTCVVRNFSSVHMSRMCMCTSSCCHALHGQQEHQTDRYSYLTFLSLLQYVEFYNVCRVRPVVYFDEFMGVLLGTDTALLVICDTTTATATILTHCL